MMMILGSLVVLAVGAAASLAFKRFPRAALGVSMIAMFLAAALTLIAAFQALLGAVTVNPAPYSWSLPFGRAELALDGLSAWFLMTIGLLAASVAIYAPAYMRFQDNKGSVPAFGALSCALFSSLILVVCAADAVMFLFGWEAMTLTAFLLVSFNHDRPEVRRGGWMYLVATHIGTALCVLPLFGVICALARTTAFSAFPGVLALAGRPLLVTLFGLAVAGFGAKAGFLPIHIWLPAAHPVAPTPVSAFLSGVVVKTGIYGILRLLTWLPPLPAACGETLLVVGVASGVMGVLYALGQHDLKRLLAYHTVENLGIIAIGIGVGMIGQSLGEPIVAVLGYAGAILHVTNHAVFKGMLFLSAGAVLHGTGTAEIERLGGLARKTPFNTLIFLTGAIAICGLPPLNGFVSEWIIYVALFAGAERGVGAVGAMSALGILSLALMGGLALACFSKVFGIIFLGEQRDRNVSVHTTPAGMKLGMAPLAVFCVLVGLAPSLWIPLTYSAVGVLAHVTDAELYASIHGAAAIASRISLLVFVLIGLTLGIAALRRIVLHWGAPSARRMAVAGLGTWGCGYGHPTPRMQYTAASFAAPLITGFRSLLWPERKLVAPKRCFPGPSHVESHVPDVAEHDVLEPLFRGIARFYATLRTVSWQGVATHAPVYPESPGNLRPLKTFINTIVAALRRGAIHVQLLFIVLTLLVLLLFEGISAKSAPGATSREPHTPVTLEMKR